MKQITQEWIDKAEGDYQAGCDLQAVARPVYDAICFHAQQCVEKYLKAWLSEQSVTFPKTHDLEALAKLCLPTLDKLSSQLSALRLLTSFAVEVRYPGMSATQADAERCWQAALDTRRVVRASLGSAE
ncbi:MAG: HEPN domain-containing protein [Anaerolineae bacterium]|nr:HEPN domain-containing protein [Candidatus Roseilinea sp.]MDW8450809.1 HEPN domain-containing protein [Anaerolineae bacterium]